MDIKTVLTAAETAYIVVASVVPIAMLYDVFVSHSLGTGTENSEAWLIVITKLAFGLWLVLIFNHVVRNL